MEEHYYTYYCQTPSDINEHLPTLYRYASECSSVLELGVRGCVSTWAFLRANPKLLILNDKTECDVNALLDLAAQRSTTRVETRWVDDLQLTLDTPVDLVFIDTYHVYGQLKRELAKFAPLCNKYIIMHDTEVDKVYGECIRSGWNADNMVLQTGIPHDEHLVGLQRAIDEFMAANSSSWVVHEVFHNCNGLTILKRISDQA